MSNIEKQAELATNIKLSFRQRIDYSISEFGYNSLYYWISAFMRCSDRPDGNCRRSRLVSDALCPHL